ncbi:MAG: ABC transporter permease [Lachnospiraceae bacterium]|nr:ABC transporter permease [Lachnospiraceae bacterium]
MKLKQSIKMAWSAILSNKMRSFLTMLGIIIGVMAVTLLISLVQGATGRITDSMSDLGANNLVVTITDYSKKLTYTELKRLEDREGVDLVSPSVTGRITAIADGNSVTADLYGITPAYETVQGLDIETGRGISEFDIEESLSVCVIGPGVAKDLFGTTEVLAHKIRINSREYRIVGVLEEEDSTMMGMTNDSIYIPLTNAQRLLKQTAMTSFYVYAQDENELSTAQESTKAFLYEKFRDEDSYTVLNMSNIVDMIDQVLGTMELMLAGIAAISLLVGGIGIMNIMLVSVTERTREIGIRKAIGAQRSDITIQFLIESVFISLIGGIIGMGISQLILTILNHLFTDYHFVISLSVAGLALGFSIGIGVIFGIYPANRAASLKPINALRYE